MVVDQINADYVAEMHQKMNTILRNEFKYTARVIHPIVLNIVLVVIAGFSSGAWYIWFNQVEPGRTGFKVLYVILY